MMRRDNWGRDLIFLGMHGREVQLDGEISFSFVLTMSYQLGRVQRDGLLRGGQS